MMNSSIAPAYGTMITSTTSEQSYFLSDNNIQVSDHPERFQPTNCDSSLSITAFFSYVPLVASVFRRSSESPESLQNIQKPGYPLQIRG
ncbi:hypothetical protein TNIN_492291 [Trichonephila inaurata madagascariensis]|uniref:Uncharacterized protein n=1 Tax=Trichonephila inaurata madagascariensis TaxID=2747483 RepID=A0A8X6IVW0_9ARAC|nr:hypothetical protein TNIN_492291 [Trichonephila inaurata madagascariensis]